MPHSKQASGESLEDMVRKLSRCRFAVGSSPKRFVRQLSSAVDHGDDLEATLSEKQKAFLKRLRYQYRKQIGGDLDAKPDTPQFYGAVKGKR